MRRRIDDFAQGRRYRSAMRFNLSLIKTVQTKPSQPVDQDEPNSEGVDDLRCGHAHGLEGKIGKKTNENEWGNRPKIENPLKKLRGVPKLQLHVDVLID